MLESIRKPEPIKRSKTDAKEDTMNHCEPGEINDVFNDKCLEYISKGDGNTSTKQYLVVM